MELKKMLDDHEKWLRAEGGERANLSGANLSGANLTGDEPHGVDLRGADLARTNLSGADLRVANLRWADLRWANLSGADLRWTDLRWANLSGANLSGANLTEADLGGANLSRTSGLLSAADWMENNFECMDDGVVVYKRFGGTQYAAPEAWKIEEGAEISEVCNPCRTDDCACGVNFGTREWCNNNYPNADLWECKIRWKDLAGVVVPYNTDGKARCDRLVLVRKIAAQRQGED